MTNAILEAMSQHPEAGDEFRVPSRGRPGRKPEDAARRALRREAFGRRLRRLREEAGLSLGQVAELTGLTSPRKLAQYETTCYPPGDIVALLAPHYRIEARDLAEMVLMHSDPALFEAITGRRGCHPTRRAVAERLEEAEI